MMLAAEQDDLDDANDEEKGQPPGRHCWRLPPPPPPPLLLHPSATIMVHDRRPCATISTAGTLRPWQHA